MSKYHAKKIETEDGVFDSKKEADRWDELRKKEVKGDISNLRRQVPYLLLPKQYVNGRLVERKLEYVADFVYERNGETIVEDVKPTDKNGNVSAYYKKTAAYKSFVYKRKMMLYFHHIQIKEI